MYDVDGVESYTVEEMAELLNVTPLSIRNYINKGLFPKNKVYGRLYVPVKDLEKYMKEKGLK